MAKIERTEEDVRQLSRVAEFNGGLRKDLLGQIGSASETTTNLIKDNPQLQNTLARLLISDLNGQPSVIWYYSKRTVRFTTDSEYRKKTVGNNWKQELIYW